MKRIGISLMMLGVFTNLAFGLETTFNKNNLSIKAGPTEPGENLSMVWIESFVSPKVVKDDKTISLGVHTTAKLKAVKATFDFTREQVALLSKDGLNWEKEFNLTNALTEGVHIARFQIEGRKGIIQRTVEFFVEKKLEASTQASSEIWVQKSSWPLTVLSSCSAYSGEKTRNLAPGTVITSLSKEPWYKVIFDDGEVGWIQASFVKEPTEEYYLSGYSAYKNKDFALAVKNYSDAVSVNPGFVKGHIWLAKSFAAIGQLDSAFEAIKKALKLDERDIEVRIVANMLAEKFYNLAYAKKAGKRYNEAIAAYRKTIDLKENSIRSRIDMGDAYRTLGMENEALSAWKDALKFDSGNAEVLAKLKSGDQNGLVANAREIQPQAKEIVAPLIADDSIQILKDEKTSKGTKIESAIKSVVSLTKSLGTRVLERGWQVKKQGNKFLVSYRCEQNGGALESFDWLVDVDSRQVMAQNDNARLLMNRW